MVIPTQVKSKRKEHDATITGQKLTLTITPVADAPTNMGGVEDVSIDLVLHNQNPQASNGVLKLDTWRDGGRASGSVTLHDADGDTVRVDSVTGSQPGTWGVDDEGTRSLVVRGDHGTLYLHEDGTYRYLLDADAAGQSGQDVFTYTVQDGFRGTDAGTITINLDNANTAPVLSGDLSASIGGNIDKYEGGLVREEGQLAWNDMEGDAIASVSIGGVALPASGEVSIVGQYGTLHVTMQGSGTHRQRHRQKGQRARPPRSHAEQTGKHRDQSFHPGRKPASRRVAHLRYRCGHGNDAIREKPDINPIGRGHARAGELLPAHADEFVEWVGGPAPFTLHTSGQARKTSFHAIAQYQVNKFSVIRPRIQ